MQILIHSPYILILLSLAACSHRNITPDTKKNSPISKINQFIFKGKRSGEAYFNNNGKEMIYQSEAGKSNPFFSNLFTKFKNW